MLFTNSRVLMEQVRHSCLNIQETRYDTRLLPWSS